MPPQPTTYELNTFLRNAGLERLCVDTTAYPYVSDLNPESRTDLVAALDWLLTSAQDQAPPISQWDTYANRLLMEDDGSSQAHQTQENFWQSISQIVFASHALIRLGEARVFPLLIEMADSLPGHPRELALDVLRQYIDPAGTLAPDALIRQAWDWWKCVRLNGPNL